MAEKDLDKVSLQKSESADFEQTESPQVPNPIPPVPTNKPSPLVWVGLGVLGIVALFVVFVLPTIVAEYELPLERRIESTSASVSQTAANPVSTISPFEEAQRSLQRKNAQDVLAELLDSQRNLEAQQVEQWGQVEYSAALAQASIGDEYYRNQDFQLARDAYAAGRDGLTRLIESIPVVLSQTLVDAQKALEDGDSALALDRFELARLLDPDNEAVQIGIARARTLDEVIALLETADQQLEDGSLESARTSYRAALNLDTYNDYAREQIADVSRRITENEFASIMSSGYTRLQSGEPEAAIAEFQRAAAIGINTDQALAAIVQAENDIANVEITRLRALISSAEEDENWQQAVTHYDQVLAIDNNLVFAVEGRDYAAKRAQLDSLLVNAIANPERFAEDAVFQETRDVYFTGRAIEPAGPKLQQQLDQLQVLLENSQVPIDVQLVSDNLTEVTLLRVGNLGVFQQQSLSLKPGRYVAVGKRTGFREVREEFMVGFGQTPSSVTVRCDEPVVTTRR